MNKGKSLADRYPVGMEVRNTITGRHGWVVGTEYVPRDDARVVHVDYRDGSAPAASSAEFTVPATGPRSTITVHEPTRHGNGWSRRWRRTLRGVPHSFTAVTMPNGERRYFVERYNGYCDDGTAEGRAFGMRFACGWSPVRSWTVKPALVLSWEANRGRPVVDVPPPSAEVLSGAYSVHHEHQPIGEYGVIVYRDPGHYGAGDYRVTTCSTARHRDETLVAFHGYYDSTMRIERFGPDLDV